MVISHPLLKKNKPDIGLYAISGKKKSRDKADYIKVGMSSSSLYNRVNSYAINPSYVHGYRCHALLILKSPKTKEERYRLAKLIESSLFKLIKKFNVKSEVGSLEVFYISRKDLYAAFSQIGEQFKKNVKKLHLKSEKVVPDFSLKDNDTGLTYLQVKEIDKEIDKEVDIQIKQINKVYERNTNRVKKGKRAVYAPIHYIP
jgi:hypothetical protein